MVSANLHSGRFEDFEVETLLASLQGGMNVLDIGANIGIYAVLSAKTLEGKGGGKVYAVEADPANVSLLLKNIRENGLTNIEVISRAASDKEAILPLYRAEYGGFCSTLGLKNPDRPAVEIEAAPGDSLIPPDVPIHVLKIDIEGWEVRALRGMRRILASPSLSLIFVEFHPDCLRLTGDDPMNLVHELEQLNFDFFHIDEQRKMLEPVLPSRLLGILDRDGLRHTNLLGRRRREPSH